MKNRNYANAYKEVLVVLKQLTEEDYKKIPKEYIEFLKENCNPNYEFEYDVSKDFEEQNLMNDTKYILFGLFEKFGATDYQKEKIRNFKINYNNKMEEIKREQYNPNDIFKKDDIQEKKQTENIQLVEYKKVNWYKKIFLKICDLIRKR